MKKSNCKCRDFGYCHKYEQRVGLHEWLSCQRRSASKIASIASNPLANRFQEPKDGGVEKVIVSETNVAVELDALQFIKKSAFFQTIVTSKLETHRNDTEKYLKEIDVEYGKLIMYPFQRWFSNRSDCTEGELFLQSHEVADFFSELEDKVFIVASCGIAYLLNKKTGKRTICLPKGIIYE